MTASNLNTILMFIALGAMGWVGTTVTAMQSSVARIEETQKHSLGAHSQYDVAITELRTRITAVELDLAKLRAEIAARKQ